MYGEWLEAERLGLKPGPWPGLEPVDAHRTFANNDLGFAGEEDFDEFDGPLAAALESWMHGGASESEGPLLSLKAAGAGPPPDLVEMLIDRAQDELDEARPRRTGRAHWVAGLASARPLDRDRSRLVWMYRGDARELILPRRAASTAAELLVGLARQPGGADFSGFSAKLSSDGALDPSAINDLRSSGLVVI
jgi:hypothetical protein